MSRIITALIALGLISSTAIASSRTTLWQDAVAKAIAEADPEGDWQRVVVDQESGASGKAQVVIMRFRDGSTSAKYYGDVTLKRGIVAGTNPERSQALLFATDVLVCDWEIGCEPLAGIEPDEIDRANKHNSCVYPLCGGNLDVLVDASPAYLVADIIEQRDGSTMYAVTDLLVGLELAFSGIEPDEID